jgi:hypothetical protein
MSIAQSYGFAYAIPQNHTKLRMIAKRNTNNTYVACRGECYAGV